MPTGAQCKDDPGSKMPAPADTCICVYHQAIREAGRWHRWLARRLPACRASRQLPACQQETEAEAG